MRRKVVDIVCCMLVILLGAMLILAWVLHLSGVKLWKSDTKDTRSVYEFNWGVTINDGWTEVYSAETDHDGRGVILRVGDCVENAAHETDEAADERVCIAEQLM